MTFSITARCARTGQFGVAISSSSPAVAARCAHARAGVGAVATQNVTDPRLGPQALRLLAEGASAGEAVAILGRVMPHPDYRQLLVVDGQGGAAIHSGAHALGIWAEARGADCAAGGNLLANAEVPGAMVGAFAAAPGALADRLLAALQGGLAAGGEAGPVRSAGLLVVDRESWPYIDLRIDWADDPIGMLAAAWAVYAPQAEAYVTRALNPTAAPSYGVPGDE
ncbi:MAG: DUF1028 domain-containing protein [Rhodobacteraceae bacterium]|nr:DUF1028 domain-containing protein [Paracoccaceae bacterium]